MKVLVVGAGASGLPALKTALENGFTATCMEKSDDIGGLWRYKPEPKDDEGTVMKSTVINTSKEMTAYSDFPPPKEVANYMHNREMLAYLRRYAENFHLHKHIKLRHKVINIERVNDFQDSGQWSVTYEDLEREAVGVEVFDGVMVCTGHHSIPYWPSPFPGQALYKGRLLHSHSYNCSQGFEDKVVVVVGIGNSGGDIAVELSKVAKQVYLSTRSGSWILNRVWDFGEPSDLAILNRFTFGVKEITPRWLQNKVLERKLNKRFDHGRFGLKPKHRFLEAHLTINDELPNRIISGTVVVKPNLSKLSESGVVFEDGSSVSHVDAVIVATGYSFSFSLIEEGKLINVDDGNRVQLYKLMFPVELSPKNTLAVIGLIQPTGSIMPISEMQSRVFCAALANHITLPKQEEMVMKMLEEIRINRKHFVDRRRHTVQVYYVNYMDSLAKMIKAKPSVLKYMIKDPVLANKLIFHGLVPYQYRLDGPHSWSGAEEAIKSVEERVFQSTMTRRTDATEKARPHSKLRIFLEILF